MLKYGAFLGTHPAGCSLWAELGKGLRQEWLHAFPGPPPLTGLGKLHSRGLGGVIVGRWEWVLGTHELGARAAWVHRVHEVMYVMLCPSSDLSSHPDATETAVTGCMENWVFNQKGETAEEGL